MGITINLLSLFGFILVLGIVVDDAIVVGESIFKELEDGKAPPIAAVNGSVRVAGAVIFAVLTTIAAFAAVSFAPGTFGQVFAIISSIVIATLVFSVIESLYILPTHLAHDPLSRIAMRFKGLNSRWQSFQSHFTTRFSSAQLNLYRPAVDIALRYRYVSLAAAISVLIVVLGLVKNDLISFQFFPEVEGDYIACGISLPAGSSAAQTLEVIEQVEKAAIEIEKEIESEYGEIIVHKLSTLGSQPITALAGTAAVEALVKGVWMYR